MSEDRRWMYDGSQFDVKGRLTPRFASHTKENGGVTPPFEDLYYHAHSRPVRMEDGSETREWATSHAQPPIDYYLDSMARKYSPDEERPWIDRELWFEAVTNTSNTKKPKSILGFSPFTGTKPIYNSRPYQSHDGASSSRTAQETEEMMEKMKQEMMAKLKEEMMEKLREEMMEKMRQENERSSQQLINAIRSAGIQLSVDQLTPEISMPPRFNVHRDGSTGTRDREQDIPDNDFMEALVRYSQDRSHFPPF